MDTSSTNIGDCFCKKIASFMLEKKIVLDGNEKKIVLDGRELQQHMDLTSE